MALYALYITKQDERFSFKSGCIVPVAKRLNRLVCSAAVLIVA